VLFFKWVVFGKLAASGMPSEGDLDSIASTFKCVVVLAEEHELLYDKYDLEKGGVRVVHKPVPDFGTLNLVDLHGLVDEIRSYEGPVLVHCYGGGGRSGLVVVAYLMATEGLGWEEALERARGIEPAFVETKEQYRTLWLYDRLLEAVPPRLFSKAIEIGRAQGRFGRGVGHASKVLELTVELSEELRRLGLAHLSTEARRALYLAALLHDIGVCRLSGSEPDDAHREHSYELMLEHAEELSVACDRAAVEKAALMARSHGRDDPVPVSADKELLTAIGVLRVADGLDYSLDQSVERLGVDRRGEGLVIKVSCRRESLSCEFNKRRADEKKLLLEDVLGMPITVE